MRNRFSVILTISAGVLFSFFFFSTSLNAQITLPIIVGNTSDTVVAGACTQSGNAADCSLRGAIHQANAGSSNSVIRFGLSCPGGACTIFLTGALPTITAPLSIVGPGVDKLTVRPTPGGQFNILSVNAPGSSVTITGLTISNGVSAGGSGGISNAFGTLNVINCTISGNQAVTVAGGIGNNDTLNVVNSTITGNQAGAGGGIYNLGSLNVTNSTISHNNASTGGGIYSSGTAHVKSSIIALNTGPTSGPDVNGDFISAGFNLIGKRDGSIGFNILATDQRGTIAAPLDPMLHPLILQDNGGTTRTIALLPGSPAIDKGTSNGLTGVLTNDQRGFYRRTFDNTGVPNAAGGDGTDIGAFEVQSRAPADFDGDYKTDIGIFRPAPAEWWIYRSSSGVTFATQFGATTDKLTPGDFTGDGKTDIAFWRPSTGFWFVLRSEDLTFFAFPWGTAGDIPAPADYTGDGRTDAAVFRPSAGSWFIVTFSQTITVTFGANGDIPVPGDYDGDGVVDVAIYRPSVGQWWITRWTGGVLATTFGNSNDKPVQGDYTGDGKCDIAFWRPSTGQWFVLRSEDFSFFSFTFGMNGDIPAPGDYDGDGRHDATVFRPSNATWFSQQTTAGTLIQQFGVNGDRPIPSVFVP